GWGSPACPALAAGRFAQNARCCPVFLPVFARPAQETTSMNVRATVLDHLNGCSSNGHAAPSANGTAGPPPLATETNGATVNSSSSAGRGKNGRFLPGNRCAAGRSYGQKTAQLRAALLDVVGPKTLKRIARKLAKQAEQGDLDAAKLLLAYTIGKPTEAADPDDLPRRQWERLTLTGRINALYSLRHAIDPQRTL